MPMIVKRPFWRQYYITFLHIDLLTIHRRETPVTFNNEPHRERFMPMRWGCFAWIDDLQT